MKTKIILILLLTIICFPAKGKAETLCTSCDSTLLVTGNGEVKAKPDKATITVEVVSRGKTANEAVSTNAASAQKLLNALTRAGIADTDIETQNVSVFPIYKDKPNLQPNDNAIIGYEARNSLIAIVRIISDVGNIIDLISSTGNYTIQGISFSLENDTTAKNDALKKAVSDADQKAKIIAASAKTSITGIKRITADNNNFIFNKSIEAAAADFSTPVQPGDLTVSASVSIEYIIDK